jgi:hypothetical protein
MTFFLAPGNLPLLPRDQTRAVLGSDKRRKPAWSSSTVPTTPTCSICSTAAPVVIDVEGMIRPGAIRDPAAAWLLL